MQDQETNVFHYLRMAPWLFKECRIESIPMDQLGGGIETNGIHMRYVSYLWCTLYEVDAAEFTLFIRPSDSNGDERNMLCVIPFSIVKFIEACEQQGYNFLRIGIEKGSVIDFDEMS